MYQNKCVSIFRLKIEIDRSKKVSICLKITKQQHNLLYAVLKTSFYIGKEFVLRAILITSHKSE